MPAHADALNDLSSMPPVSVTMHALYAAAALPPLPLGVLSGALPHAAAASVSPPAARTATIRFPRTGRKTPSFHYTPLLRGALWRNTSAALTIGEVIADNRYHVGIQCPRTTAAQCGETSRNRLRTVTRISGGGSR